MIDPAFIIHVATHARAAGAVRRVPPAEETQRRLQEEEGGQGSTNKEWCMAAGFNPASLKVRVFKKQKEMWGRACGTGRVDSPIHSSVDLIHA